MAMKERVLFFVDGLNRGGVEIVVSQLANNISKLGHEVHLVCLYQDQNELKAELCEDVFVHNLPFKSNLGSRIDYLRFSPELITLLKEIKPHIVHAHNSSFSYLFLSFAILLSRIKCINIRSIHFNGFFLEKKTLGEKLRFSFDWLASVLLKSTIISVSPTVFSTVQHRYSNNKHICITNGVDTEYKFLRKNLKKTDLGIDEDCKVAVYVARICEGKNHQTLIEAWEALVEHEKTSLLVLVGDGPYKEFIQGQVRDKQLTQHVLFTGSISNVEDYLSIADVGVFVSESEGLGLGLLEMMSVGLPVVASKIPVFLNIIEDNVNGLFYNTYDAGDLASKIQIMFTDKNLRCSLGSSARRFVVNNYSINKMVNEHYKLYKELSLKHGYR